MWARLNRAHRNSTRNAHRLHFRTFVAFLAHFKCSVSFQLQHILCFIEYLATNGLSHKVISQYISSLRTLASWYNIPHDSLSHPSVHLLLRSLRINNTRPPPQRDIFSLDMLRAISRQCDFTLDPLLYRAIFLTSFFGFLRMSNVAPHSKALFDPERHLLRQDVIFKDPGAHIRIKWTKTLQDNRAHHWIQLPKLRDQVICPVLALYKLLHSRSLPPNKPLLVTWYPPHDPIIDTHIRDTLKRYTFMASMDPQRPKLPCF